MVIHRGLLLTGIGIIFGFAGSWALTRFLQSLLFATSTHDPVTLGAVVVILFIVATLACWIPARNAVRVDPMIALRAE
jgi:putative ABC transport system permease protein